MDEKPDQIIDHIEAQRSELGRNLNELETRVRRKTDWRTYYDKNPGLAMGAALGGGLLLGVMVKSKGPSIRRSSSRRRPSSTSTTYAGASAMAGTALGAASSAKSSAKSGLSSPVTSEQWRQVSETLDHVKAALIGFGVTKVKEFLNQAIPGLEEHLSQAEHRGRQHSSGPGGSRKWDEPSEPGSTGRSTPSETHSWQSTGAQHQEPSPVSF